MEEKALHLRKDPKWQTILVLQDDTLLLVIQPAGPVLARRGHFCRKKVQTTRGLRPKALGAAGDQRKAWHKPVSAVSRRMVLWSVNGVIQGSIGSWDGPSSGRGKDNGQPGCKPFSKSYDG